MALKRLAAFACDYLIIGGYIACLGAAALTMRQIAGEFVAPSDPLLMDLFAFVILVLPVTLYFAFSEASSVGATWGKRRLGLRVLAAEGGALTLRRSLIRSAVKFLPWQIAHTSLFHIPGWPVAPEAPPSWAVAGLLLTLVLMGTYLWELFLSSGHRTVYDLTAGSRVVSPLDQSLSAAAVSGG